jgi:hypothetical protein
MSTEQKRSLTSKEIFTGLRKSLSQNLGDFWHVHLEEYEEKDRPLVVKILNRLARRGVILRAHESMYVINTPNNRKIYSK